MPAMPVLRSTRLPNPYRYQPRLKRSTRLLWALGSALDALRVPVFRVGRFCV